MQLMYPLLRGEGVTGRRFVSPFLQISSHPHKPRMERNSSHGAINVSEPAEQHGNKKGIKPRVPAMGGGPNMLRKTQSASRRLCASVYIVDASLPPNKQEE